MCGIAGFLADQEDLQATSRLEAMLASLFHRGPDEGGQLIDGALAMGMRRLSIIDLADGSQPVFDESGRFGIVFNGEIYNYRELREQLISRGHRLKTKSDTETIVHLYEELGPQCVHQLRGMFGLAIWDSRERELFVARDRVGIKPLYYTEVNGNFLFGSEIKAILTHPVVKREVDMVALSQYLSLKYVPAPRTLFSGIQSLLPGHWVRVKEGRIIEKQRYWDISFAHDSGSGNSPKHEGEYLDELQSLLRETISLHLRSDVPFGAFLSGGLDSSTIVALMSEQLSSPVKTFSVGFDGAGLQDELPYAAQVAKAFGCEHHTLKIRSQDFLDLAENVLWHLDQPIADQATIATHMVAKLARQHVKMVLTGEGGDELFAGYARYSGERYSPFTSWLPSPIGRSIRTISQHMPGLRRAKIAINALTVGNEAKRFSNWFPMFNDETKRHLFTESYSQLCHGAGEVFEDHLASCDSKEPLNRMLYADTKLWLVDYLLLRGDKLTMSNSLEARVPLLDHRVVEFAARLPVNMKLRGGQRKYLLRQFARKLLPNEVIDRKKQGFPIPIAQWLRHEAKPMMSEMLSEDSLRRRGFFDHQFVASMIQKHTSGYCDYSTELWGLVSLEMWMRQFIDAQATEKNLDVSAPLRKRQSLRCH